MFVIYCTRGSFSLPNKCLLWFISEIHSRFVFGGKCPERMHLAVAGIYTHLKKIGLQERWSLSYVCRHHWGFGESLCRWGYDGWQDFTCLSKCRSWHFVHMAIVFSNSPVIDKLSLMHFYLEARLAHTCGHLKQIPQVADWRGAHLSLPTCLHCCWSSLQALDWRGTEWERECRGD